MEVERRSGNEEGKEVQSDDLVQMQTAIGKHFVFRCPGSGSETRLRRDVVPEEGEELWEKSETV
ncbi:hypothetical protein EYF80_020972 [Liparis tanakae]|uniref:Uncharacterized protein n=1 Tax=Liparis tanakae TaxID=230148 RepID=A0A4Z2HUT9_9TELE|nr:hypothetical protein EYF80_020972 [Liparis tanakae]